MLQCSLMELYQSLHLLNDYRYPELSKMGMNKVLLNRLSDYISLLHQQTLLLLVYVCKSVYFLFLIMFQLAQFGCSQKGFEEVWQGKETTLHVHLYQTYRHLCVCVRFFVFSIYDINCRQECVLLIAQITQQNASDVYLKAVECSYFSTSDKVSFSPKKALAYQCS